MKNVVELFLRRPVFTWVLVIGLVVLGITGLGKMPIERYPNVDFPFVSVTISAPGMSARQIESEIAQRVEGALGTVSGLERLDAVCTEGVAVVSAQFTLDKSSTDAANDVRDRIARLADELPPTARPAKIETFNVNSSPIVLLGVTSPNGARTLREVTELADTQLRRELQSIRGVGEVRLVGGETRTLSIVLDPEKLASFGVTALEVQRALAVESLEAPGGDLPDGDTSLGVRLSAKARTADEIRAVAIAKRGNYTVFVQDVATVDDAGIPADSRASLSGSAAVIVAVMKQPGANTVAVTDDVRERLEAAKKRLPDGVEARILQDNSEDVRASVAAVTEHLVIGAILAAAVVLLFLRNVRATLIAAIAIPTSIVGTFAVARALGLTLNMLSLLGLTLAVGIVIDDAIVVLENIVRVMEQKKLSAREAAGEATREIGLAVLATTLSLVAVFLPVAAMEGIVGRYLAPFSITMSASILLSMGVAFTLTPMLSSRWLKKSEPSAEGVSHGHGGGPLEAAYARALGWLVARKWVAGIGIVLTLASVVPVMAVLPTTFVPVEDVARYSVFVRLPESASLDKTADVAESIAALARTMPDVSDTAVSTLNARDATVTVFLGRRGVQEARILETRKVVSARFAKEGYLTMVGPVDDFAFPGPDGAAIQFVLRGGKDPDDLERVAKELLVAANGIPGTVDRGITSGGGRPELSVAVDRSLAKRVGVTHADIGATLALVDKKGIDLGSVHDARSRTDVSIPVRLRIASGAMSNEDVVRQLAVRGDGGAAIPLADLASIATKEGPGLVRRVGRERQITLFMNTLPGASDGAVVEALTKKLAEIDPSGSVRGEVLGNAKEMEKAFSAFVVAIGLSFVFMYLVLAAQFESWIHPITILVSLPLTVPFGLVSLLAFGQTLNLFSVLGFLVLFGVVKKNAILQVDRAIQLRKEGHSPERAIVEACRDRLRPILMTTLAFVAGMIPLVVSSGAGAATNRAIAVGILGGQTLSLVLTLLATPVVYLWLDRSKKTAPATEPAPVLHEVPDAA